jgi:hypothetical protein
MIRGNILRFVAFVREREQVRRNKEAGQPAPWTDDPILRTYRFCNVRREDDKVTRWIRQNWTQRYRKDPDHWFAMVVARLFNKPETLAAVSMVLPFQKAFMRRAVNALKHDGHAVFSAAYIVSTNGRKMDKVDYLLDCVLDPLWDNRALYRPMQDEDLRSFHLRLTQAQGMGSFMAAQVVADEKNNPDSPLGGADDWWTWAAPGPGSLRGLNRILGNGPVKTGFSGSYFLHELNKLQDITNDKTGMRLCAQDIQNCLCEFDKYERVRLGEGKPKQRYTP